MNETKSKLSRRNFLIAAGAARAAAVAAIVNPAPAPDQLKATASNDKRRGKGYQDTAHVRSYYNTAKV
jgi:secreted PhoX family phosphatase